MLKAQGLCHAFEYSLYNSVDLVVSPLDTIAILGASGSGKSTLLHNLSSFLKPLSGNVIFNDTDIYEVNETERIKIRRDYFSVIFQQHYLFRGFSGADNVKIVSLLTNNELDENLAKRLGVFDVIGQNASTLSGGQQQRISILRTLTKRPKIIFADEPTGNLDRDTANETMKAINEYVQNNSAALVCVTHDENVARNCAFVYRLENKNLIRC